MNDTPHTPGAVSSASGRPSALLAVVSYTLRACLPTKRRLALLLPCGGALLFGALAHADTGPAAEAYAMVADIGIFALVIPIGCLVIGDSVLGAEVRSGALTFTWLSPVPLLTIVAGRWLAGVALATATVTPAVALSALVAGVPRAMPAVVIAALAGCAAYLGLFILIGCTTRRAAIWSLAVVFLGERLLGTELTGIAQLSPMWEARAVFAGLGPGTAELARDGIPDGWVAFPRLALIGIATLAVATWRLGRLQLTGGGD